MENGIKNKKDFIREVKIYLDRGESEDSTNWAMVYNLIAVSNDFLKWTLQQDVVNLGEEASDKGIFDEKGYIGFEYQYLFKFLSDKACIVELLTDVHNRFKMLFSGKTTGGK